MITAAVDPGLSGAIAIIDGTEPKDFFDMPTVKEGTKNTVDWPKFVRLIEIADQVVVEQVGASPQSGVSSAFSFGGSFTGVRAAAAGLGIPCSTITPVRWKTLFGLLKQPKDAARLLVIDLYQHLAVEFKLKKSCDKADALLLGLAWLRLNGGAIVKSKN